MEWELQSLPIHLGPTAAWDPSVVDKVGTLQTDRRVFWGKLRQGCGGWQGCNCRRPASQAQTSSGSLKPCYPTLRFQDPEALWLMQLLCVQAAQIQAINTCQGRGPFSHLLLLHVTTSGKIITGEHTQGLSVSQLSCFAKQEGRSNAVSFQELWRKM